MAVSAHPLASVSPPARHRLICIDDHPPNRLVRINVEGLVRGSSQCSALSMGHLPYAKRDIGFRDAIAALRRKRDTWMSELGHPHHDDKQYIVKG